MGNKVKKKFKEEELKQLKSELLENWKTVVGEEEGFNETWQVVEDASRYSFNASHSLSYAYDSLYGAFLKSHYPLEYYSVALSTYSGDNEKTVRLINELNYFGIKLKQPKFRYSKAEYFMDKKHNIIYKGLESIKYMNKNVADEMYKLRNNEYNNFIELLIDLKEKTTINSRQLEILITSDFFEEFGKSQKLFNIVDIYNNILAKKLKSKKGEVSFNKASLIYPKELIEKYATEKSKEERYKQYKVEDAEGLCNELIEQSPNIEMSSINKARKILETFGECHYSYEDYPMGVCIVLDINTKYKTKKCKLFNISTGRTKEVKIGEGWFDLNPVKELDVIEVYQMNSKPKIKYVEVETVNKKGETVIKKKREKTDEMETWLSEYVVLSEQEIEELNKEEYKYRIENL